MIRSMITERVVQLDSQDAVVVRDRGAVTVLYADRLDELQRQALRPHLLAAIGTDNGAAAVAVPAGAVGPMLAAPFDPSTPPIGRVLACRASRYRKR